MSIFSSPTTQWMTLSILISKNPSWLHNSSYTFQYIPTLESFKDKNLSKCTKLFATCHSWTWIRYVWLSIRYFQSQFCIQLFYKPHFGTWILLFGPFGQLRAVRKKPIRVLLKVHIFREGNKILRNLPLTFDYFWLQYTQGVSLCPKNF